MRAHSRRDLGLAALLSAGAGFVDAAGFIHLGGYFVAFMTGNSTRAAASLAAFSLEGFVAAFSLIAAFLAGVVAASLLRRRVPSRPAAAVCFLSGGPLLLAWMAAGAAGAAGALTAPLLALAMGALNAVFERNGEVTIGLTYMTGTLVKLGQGIAAALSGQPSSGARRYFLLWASLTAGSLAGGLGYLAVGLHCLPAAAALVLAVGMIMMRTPAAADVREAPDGPETLND